MKAGVNESSKVSNVIYINTTQFSLNYDNFLWKVVFLFNEKVIFFENKTRNIWKMNNIYEGSLCDFISSIYDSSALSRNL